MALTGPQNSADVSEREEIQRCCFEALASRSRLDRSVGPIRVDADGKSAKALTRLSLQEEEWIHARQLFSAAVRMTESLRAEGERISEVEEAHFRSVVATNLRFCARDITNAEPNSVPSPFSATFLTDRERRIEVSSQFEAGRLPKTELPPSLFVSWLCSQPRGIWDHDERAFPQELAEILGPRLEGMMLGFWFEWVSTTAFGAIQEERGEKLGHPLIRSMTGFKVPPFEAVSNGPWESVSEPIGEDLLSPKGLPLLQAQTFLCAGHDDIGEGTMTFAFARKVQRQKLEARAHQMWKEGTPGNRSFVQWLEYKLRTLKEV